MVGERALHSTNRLKVKTMVTDYLTLRTILIFLAAVSVPLLLRFLIRLLKRNSREKELRQKAQDRQREETLDLVLLNPQRDLFLMRWIMQEMTKAWMCPGAERQIRSWFSSRSTMSCPGASI
jgi:hypothetical protein